MNDYVAPLAVVLFGAGFYELNHWLHRFAGIAFGEVPRDGGRGDLPRDRWLGLAYLVCLSPIMFATPLRGHPYIATTILVGWPAVATFALGVWRSRQSVSALLFCVAHAGEMALLWLADPTAAIQTCLSEAARLKPTERTQTASFCAEQAAFWLST